MASTVRSNRKERRGQAIAASGEEFARAGMRGSVDLIADTLNAAAGGRLACRVGLHRWDFRTDVTAGVITDRAWCKRPCCRYQQPMIVSREPSPAARTKAAGVAIATP